MMTETTCPACGAFYKIGAKFCPKCGIRFDYIDAEVIEEGEAANQGVTCPDCGFECLAQEHFCRRCGKALTTVETTLVVVEEGPTCQHCGNLLRRGAKFCHKCGLAVISDAAVSLPEGPVCPSCLAPLKTRSRYCQKCGTRLADETVAVEGTAEPSEASQPESAVSENETTAEMEEQYTGIRCSNCGTPLEAGIIYCRQCGIKLADVMTGHVGDLDFCRGCQRLMEVGQSFCPYCGVLLVELSPEEASGRLCHHCHTAVDEGEMFCSNCGATLITNLELTPEKPEVAQPPLETAPDNSGQSISDAPGPELPAGDIGSIPSAFDEPFPDEPTLDAPGEDAPVTVLPAPDEPELLVTEPPSTMETPGTGQPATPEPPWKRGGPEVGAEPIKPSPLPVHPVVSGSRPGKKPGFPWWLIAVLLVVAIVVGGYFLFFTKQGPYKTDFVNETAASGWSFTSYSSTSSLAYSKGAVIYDGLYVYNAVHQDITMSVSGALAGDKPLDPNGYICFWLRLNPQLRKGYCFIIKPSTHTAMLGVAGDASPKSVDILTVLPGFDPAQTHTYTIRAKADRFYFSIDGVAVLDLYDVGLTSGQPAIEANKLGLFVTRVELTSGE